MFNFFLSLVMCIGFLSCSKETPIAGTGSETETTIVGQLVNNTGFPVARAILNVKEEKNNIDVWSDSVETDQQGYYGFVVPTTGSYILHGTYNNEVISRRFSVNELKEDTLTLGADTLRLSGTFTGIVKNKIGEIVPSKIMILGLAGDFYTDDSGIVQISGLKTGMKYQVQIRPLLETYREREYEIQASSDTVSLFIQPIEDYQTILLDDFEDGDSLGLLHTINGGSEWWKGYIHPEKTTSLDLRVIENPLACSFCTTPLNKVLYANMNVDENVEFDFVNFGLNLKRGWNFENNEAYVSFEKLGFIRFKARGTSNFLIQFSSLFAINEFGNNQQFQKEVSLSHQWQQIYISQADIQDIILESGVYSWKSARNQIWAISFLAVSDLELWIDDLEIQGLDSTEFILP